MTSNESKSTTRADSGAAAARLEPAPSGAEVLRLTDVCAGYGQADVISGISLSVKAGEIVALLGPNGAGKTTTLRVASGLLKPRTGQIHLAGRDVTADPPFRRARDGVCLVPEGRGVFKDLTVRENIALQSGKGRASVRRSVDRVAEVFPPLAKRMSEVAGRLSGGQQQMLALSRAYIGEPKVILLDEVSMGLAPLIVAEIFDALRVLAQQGVAMVLVEQYVGQALSMADTVVMISRGNVVFNGSPDDLDEASVLEGYLGVSAS
jgi:branched-chain amino acid transport system ATP-binding protein